MDKLDDEDFICKLKNFNKSKNKINVQDSGDNTNFNLNIRILCKKFFYCNLILNKDLISIELPNLRDIIMENLNEDNIIFMLYEIMQKYELKEGQDQLEKFKLKMIFKFIFQKIFKILDCNQNTIQLDSEVILETLSKDDIFSFFIIALREYHLNDSNFESLYKKVFDVN